LPKNRFARPEFRFRVTRFKTTCCDFCKRNVRNELLITGFNRYTVHDVCVICLCSSSHLCSPNLSLNQPSSCRRRSAIGVQSPAIVVCTFDCCNTGCQTGSLQFSTVPTQAKTSSSKFSLLTLSLMVNAITVSAALLQASTMPIAAVRRWVGPEPHTKPLGLARYSDTSWRLRACHGRRERPNPRQVDAREGRNIGLVHLDGEFRARNLVLWEPLHDAVNQAQYVVRRCGPVYVLGVRTEYLRT
jgi:hypothetical protein